MALIDKIKAIADSIRCRTGISELMSLDEMPDMIDNIACGISVTDDNAGNVTLVIAGYRVSYDNLGNIEIR